MKHTESLKPLFEILAVRIRSPRLDALLCKALVLLFRVLFSTVRLEYRAEDPRTIPTASGGATDFLYIAWHDTIVLLMFGWQSRPSTVALVGPHRDGSYVSHILREIGVGTVRGSSSKQGAKAVRRLITATTNSNIAVTPDGPRGPEHVLKSGPAFVASRTGKGVVPTGFHFSRTCVFRGSWTSLILPVPFSRVTVCTAKPYYIPADATREELEHHTAFLQGEMDRLYRNDPEKLPLVDFTAVPNSSENGRRCDPTPGVAA